MRYQSIGFTDLQDKKAKFEAYNMRANPPPPSNFFGQPIFQVACVRLVPCEGACMYRLCVRKRGRGMLR